MKLKTLLKINIVLFSLIFLVHLYRLIFYFSVQVSGWEVPIWLNIIAVVIVAIIIWLNYKQMK